MVPTPPIPQDARGGRRLGGALDERGPDEDEVARHSVGQHSSADHHEGLDALPDREHDTERGRGRHVEDREGERDPGDPVAGVVIVVPEEQTEVALLERAEAFAKRRGHGRRLVARTARLPVRRGAGRDRRPG